MYEAVTRNVQVIVEPEYLAAESDPHENRFIWAYTITVTNGGSETIQLLSRHWRITDGHGEERHVRGEGVVGQQPVLRPGERFRYTSGCPLTTAHGSMVGSYLMVSEGGDRFEVEIPAFALLSPHLKPTLH